jgi:2-oxoglutarate ferredoxin oxidoreductase subunit gamma
VISDEEIGSPMVSHPSAVIAMNLPSLDKYADKVKAGGVLIVNQSMVDRAIQRTDIKVAMVPANAIAEELGDKRMTNMVLLGALLASLDILPPAAVEKALKEHLPERHHKLLPLNKEALQRGAAFTAELVSA